MIKKAPCKDCKYREPLCHSSCKSYMNYKEESRERYLHIKDIDKDTLAYISERGKSRQGWLSMRK